jgi:hypothetical protein
VTALTTIQGSLTADGRDRILAAVVLDLPPREAGGRRVRSPGIFVWAVEAGGALVLLHQSEAPPHQEAAMYWHVAPFCADDGGWRVAVAAAPCGTWRQGDGSMRGRGGVTIWDVETGRMLYDLTGKDGQEEGRPTYSCRTLCVADGENGTRRLVYGSQTGRVRIWELGGVSNQCPALRPANKLG